MRLLILRGASEEIRQPARPWRRWAGTERGRFRTVRRHGRCTHAGDVAAHSRLVGPRSAVRERRFLEAAVAAVDLCGLVPGARRVDSVEAAAVAGGGGGWFGQRFHLGPDDPAPFCCAVRPFLRVVWGALSA